MNGIPFNRRRAAEIRGKCRRIKMQRACLKLLTTHMENTLRHSLEQMKATAEAERLARIWQGTVGALWGWRLPC